MLGTRLQTGGKFLGKDSTPSSLDMFDLLLAQQMRRSPLDSTCARHASMSSLQAFIRCVAASRALVPWQACQPKEFPYVASSDQLRIYPQNAPIGDGAIAVVHTRK